MKMYECLIAAQLESNQSGKTLVMVNDEFGEGESHENYEYCLPEWKDRLYKRGTHAIIKITPSKASKENFDEAQKTLTELYAFIQENYDGL